MCIQTSISVYYNQFSVGVCYCKVHSKWQFRLQQLQSIMVNLQHKLLEWMSAQDPNAIGNGHGQNCTVVCTTVVT